MLKFNNKGFTLVELMVVVVIIAILATTWYLAAQGYISRAQDATRMSDLQSLVQAISTYKGSNIRPPLNQYALVEAGYMNSIPVDPDNKKLYQYNADVRWWSKSFMGQWSAGDWYLVATNQPMYDKNNSEVYDGEEYKNKTAKPKVHNLKYMGGYLIMWNGDANFLTDNGMTDSTSLNKSTNSSWPSTAPADCGSLDGSSNSQLDPVSATDSDTLKANSWKNILTSIGDVYAKDKPGSICKIIIKSDWNGKSVVNAAKDLTATTGNDKYQDYYK